MLGVDRVTVTRWINQKRSPSFNEVLRYEESTQLPFECFITRNPDLKMIREKLELQLEKIKDQMLK